MTKQTAAPRTYLTPDVPKIIEAICFVITEAVRKHKKSVTQYDIVKSLFLADRKHMNTFGRPITFDNYCAMKFGPVPSLAYNLLKNDAPSKRKYKLTKLPWKRTASSRPGDNWFHYSTTHTEVDDEILSPSDIEALKGAVATICSLSFGQIKRLTHDDPAYVEAWDDESTRKSFDMSLGMLFDSPNYEAAERIQYLSKHR